MEMLLARASVSITELKKSPSTVIEQAQGAPIAILNHNKPEAYLVPAATFAALMEWIEDIELAEIIKQRKGSPEVEVALDAL
ncbi:MAG: type II toxin-antitoxin system prevent-host-death family antitoxin [Pseudomonadota bacterium]